MKITSSQKRIRELMDYYNINLSELSSRTGVQKSALSNYLHGTREPRQDKISQIADAFGVSPSWLMGYDTEMHGSDNNPAPDEKLRELYEMYTHASPEIQKAVEMILRSAGSKP